MKQHWSCSDTLSLGLVVFSFFFGAGNLIFPPLAGQLAGHQAGWALLGFILSGVCLPMVAMVAVARVGTLRALLSDLPQGVATLFLLVLFFLLGPGLVTPRIGLITYEIAFKPLFEQPGLATQSGITALFFALTLLLCWQRGQLISTLGKIVTPILLLLLVGLVVAALLCSQGVVQAPQGDYSTHPFCSGFLEGYQTMDAFAALMFGGLLIDLLHTKGISTPRARCCVLMQAGLMAAIGLSIIYGGLFWLGATSSRVVPQAANGARLLATYMQALLGLWGQVLLALVVILACLTTAVGLLSAFSNYLARLTSFPYRFWIVMATLLSALVANIDLTTLLTLSKPLLFALYPLLITMVLLSFIRAWLPYARLRYRWVMSIMLLLGILDACRVVGMDMCWLRGLPGFEVGLGWLVPLALMLLLLCLPPLLTKLALTVPCKPTKF